MDIKFINAFITGLLNVSSTLGLSDLKRTGLSKKERLEIDKDVNILLGMTGGMNGNIVLSMPEATARNIASTMMGGMEVTVLDMMPKSALCELANMIAGNSIAGLDASSVAMSPPTLISGQNIVALVSLVETLVIEFTATAGAITMSIALES